MSIKVVALWRFPFKSMRGERVDSLHLTERGADNDRLFALRELASHKLATARQYPQLLQYQARVREQDGGSIEVIRPDGGVMPVQDETLAQHFSEELGKKVQVAHAFDERNPEGLFDDCQILMASMQSLASFESIQPQSRFDPRRFRANIWIDVEGSSGFPEEAWVGSKVCIGDEVELAIEKVCKRCVMTTLPQEDLERDNEILKTIVQKNDSALGVYAAITHGGIIRVGDHLSIR